MLAKLVFLVPSLVKNLGFMRIKFSLFFTTAADRSRLFFQQKQFNQAVIKSISVYVFLFTLRSLLKSLADYDALIFHAYFLFHFEPYEVSREKTISRTVVALNLTLLSKAKVTQAGSKIDSSKFYYCDKSKNLHICRLYVGFIMAKA